MNQLFVLRTVCLCLTVFGASGARAEIPFGARTIDQSSYALGSFRLNVVFLESDGSIDVNQEDWSAEQLDNVRNEIDEGVAFWEGLTAGLRPDVRLSIDVNYVNGGVPLATGYEPIRRSHTQDALWINQAMDQLGYDSSSKFTNVRNFNQQSRIDGDTHWSSTVFVVNDLVDEDNRFSSGFFAYAYIGGPYAVFTYENNGWGIDRFNQVFSHELAHMFFALDEYELSGARNTQRSGYLNGINGNAQRDGSGAPVEAPQPDALMINNTLDPSPFMLVQVGILDSDGDTIPDILDTFPILTGDDPASDQETGTFVFAGVARVNPLHNLNPTRVGIANSRSDITINTIAAAQYNLNGAGWTVFPAADGDYGSYDESLQLTLASLPGGLHTIDIRALNSMGNPSEALSFSFDSHNPVPEPAGWSLAATAILLVVGRCRHG